MKFEDFYQRDARPRYDLMMDFYERCAAKSVSVDDESGMQLFFTPDISSSESMHETDIARAIVFGLGQQIENTVYLSGLYELAGTKDEIDLDGYHIEYFKNEFFLPGENLKRWTSRLRLVANE